MEKQYAYMINYPEGKMCIVYHLGKYYVAFIAKSSKGVIMRFIRQYKTLRGAENYLLKDYSYSGRNAPEIEYATEAYIKKGEYWK